MKKMNKEAVNITNDTPSRCDKYTLEQLIEIAQKLEFEIYVMERINRDYYQSGHMAGMPYLAREEQQRIGKFLALFPYETPYSYSELARRTDAMQELRRHIFNRENTENIFPYKITAGKGYTIEEKPDQNSIWFIFEAKPTGAILNNLCRYGFEPKQRGRVWIRSLNAQGRWASKLIAGLINTLA